LLFLDRADPARPVIQVFDGNGELSAKIPFSVPDAVRVIVGSVARAPDGTLALVGSAYSSDRRGAVYLAVISGDGQRQRVIRLNPFAPFQVAIASDGSYWIAGLEKAEDRRETLEHNMIRRFNASGDQIGAYVPRSTMVTDRRHEHPVDFSLLTTSRDRVGWYSNSAREYIELSLDGRVLTRVAGLPLIEPSRVDGIGICDSGNVYVSVYPISIEDRRSELFTLNRENRSWQPVTFSSGSDASPYRTVFGCQGDDVVTRARLPGELFGLTWLRPGGAP
jgi:hypothetical protein